MAGSAGLAGVRAMRLARCHHLPPPNFHRPTTFSFHPDVKEEAKDQALYRDTVRPEAKRHASGHIRRGHFTVARD
eukprot:16276878-Heterocapsa_arctica.AAC.1